LGALDGVQSTLISGIGGPAAVIRPESAA
jgi:hypothetical protein